MIKYKFGVNKELWEKAYNTVSDRHPVKCVCGRITSGLHEYNCSKFFHSVERHYNMLERKK